MTSVCLAWPGLGLTRDTTPTCPVTEQSEQTRIGEAAEGTPRSRGLKGDPCPHDLCSQGLGPKPSKAGGMASPLTALGVGLLPTVSRTFLHGYPDDQSVFPSSPPHPRLPQAPLGKPGPTLEADRPSGTDNGVARPTSAMER